jgi:N-acetylglucosamine kinase-like BadF-type ATPase
MPSVAQKLAKLPDRTAQIYFVGVDGGGTKTSAVIIDSEGRIVAQGKAGASNPVRIGIENAVSNVLEAVSNASDDFRINTLRIAAATLGIAGVRRADFKQRISERVQHFLKIKHVQVVTDAEIALFGSVQDKAGLVVIAGTGSICLGKNANGERFSAGGWGPLAGDEGGAARISREALRAIAKASDGRGTKTKLLDKALKYFRAGKPDDLIIAIYTPQVDNQKVAGFAKFVYEAAIEGDKAAIKIMKNAGRELGIAANAVIRKLKMKEAEFPIGKVGSVFKAEPFVTDSMAETVRKFAPKAYLIDPILQPAEAAAHLAMKFYEEETR